MGLTTIPVSCLAWWPSPGVYKHYGRVNGDLQEHLPQGGPSRTAAAVPLSLNPSWPRRHPTPAGSFGPASDMGHFSFLLGLGACKILFCPPRLESLFPLVLWKSCNQVPLAFRVIFPRGSQSVCWTPRLGSLTRGLEPLQQWENFGVVVPVCGSPIQRVWGLIWTCLCPFYHLGVASSLSLDMGHPFLVASSVLLLMAVQKLVAVLVLL